MNIACNDASVSLSQSQGKDWEHFWLGDEYVFSNQIPDAESYTRTHPGWILHDNNKCEWNSADIPPRLYAEAVVEEPPVNPVQMDVAGGEGGGAFLLLLAVAGAGVYAFFQQRRDKADFADNYHPMSDVPMLPMVATDENLELLYERVQHPQYQGITEPNPFAQYSPVEGDATETPPPPPPSSTYVPPVDSTDYSTGGIELVVSEEQFWNKWLPAPAKGYFLNEESLMSNSSQARQIVRDAIRTGVSCNKLCNAIFKVSKKSRGHQLILQLIESVEREFNA